MPHHESKHEHQSDATHANDKPADLLSHPSHQELIKQLDEAEQKVNQHWERILRMQAENENLIRRAERDVSSAHKYALEKFANELLPIVDSLELCVANTASEDANVQTILDGVNLTLKMFYNAMEKFGLKQVNPVSEPFDPEYQQAISTQVDNTVEPGTVLSVLQKGYTLNNRLLRPALVVVSKAE